LFNRIEEKQRTLISVFMLCSFCQSFVVDPNKCNYRCGTVAYALFVLFLAHIRMQSGKGCQPLKDDDMSFNYINRSV